MAIAFEEPTKQEKALLVSQMHRASSLSAQQREEFEFVIKELRLLLDSNIRSVTNGMANNGQNHYFGIRALNDPEESLEAIVKQKDVQLAGEEFFGINRFFGNVPDIADVQWWALYKGNNWALHTRSSEGEHLETGYYGWGDLDAAVIKVNGKALTVEETLSFYRTIKKRERNGFTQKFKPEEVRDAIKRYIVEKVGNSLDKKALADQGFDIDNVKPISDNQKNMLKKLGLILDDGSISYSAWSIFCGLDQTAKIRKRLDEAVNELRNGKKPLSIGNGFFDTYVLMMHEFLSCCKLDDLTKKKAFSKDDIKRIKQRNEDFRLRFGMTLTDFFQLTEITEDCIQYEFLKPLAPGCFPVVKKAAGDLEETIVEKLKDKYGSRFQQELETSFENTLRACNGDFLDMFGQCWDFTERHGIKSRKKLEQILEARLTEQLQSPRVSNEGFVDLFSKYNAFIEERKIGLKKKLEHILEERLKIILGQQSHEDFKSMYGLKKQIRNLKRTWQDYADAVENAIKNVDFKQRALQAYERYLDSLQISDYFRTKSRYNSDCSADEFFDMIPEEEFDKIIKAKIMEKVEAQKNGTIDSLEGILKIKNDLGYQHREIIDEVHEKLESYTISLVKEKLKGDVYKVVIEAAPFIKFAKEHSIELKGLPKQLKEDRDIKLYFVERFPDRVKDILDEYDSLNLSLTATKDRPDEIAKVTLALPKKLKHDDVVGIRNLIDPSCSYGITQSGSQVTISASYGYCDDVREQILDIAKALWTCALLEQGEQLEIPKGETRLKPEFEPKPRPRVSSGSSKSKYGGYYGLENIIKNYNFDKIYENKIKYNESYINKIYKF